MKVAIEYTDTFAGEANYGWCRRASFEMSDHSSDLAIVRAAKKAISLEGIRCRKSNYGEMIVLRPCGTCTVAFITFS